MKGGQVCRGQVPWSLGLGGDFHTKQSPGREARCKSDYKHKLARLRVAREATLAEQGGKPSKWLDSVP